VREVGKEDRGQLGLAEKGNKKLQKDNNNNNLYLHDYDYLQYCKRYVKTRTKRKRNNTNFHFNTEQIFRKSMQQSIPNSSITTHLYPSHCATQNQSFFRVLSLVVRYFPLFVHSRLEAFFYEREVRSRHESVPRSKQQSKEKTTQCWTPAASLISPYHQL